VDVAARGVVDVQDPLRGAAPSASCMGQTSPAWSQGTAAAWETLKQVCPVTSAPLPNTRR